MNRFLSSSIILLASIYSINAVRYEGTAIQLMISMTEHLSDYYLIINTNTSIKFYKGECSIKNNKFGIWSIDNMNRCLSVDYTINDNNLRLENSGGYNRQRKVLAIKYNMDNYNNDFTEQEIKSVIWEDANGYFTDLSRGRLSISPIITYYEINAGQTNYPSCSYMNWYFDARNILLQQRLLVDNFQHIVLFISPEVNCNGAGVAVIGRSNEALPIWIMSHAKTVVFHEFGHSFGLNHARIDLDHDLQIDINGEYSDVSDIMGYSTNLIPAFNGPHCINLEWVDRSDILTIESSKDSENKTIIIDSLSRLYTGQTTAPVIIAVPFDNRTYYISYITYTPRNQLFEDYQNKLTLHYQWKDNTGTYLVALIDKNQHYNNKIRLSLDDKNDTHAFIRLNSDYSSFGDKIIVSIWCTMTLLMAFVYNLIYTYSN